MVGLHYGLIIGLVTGLFSFVPYIGMLVGARPRAASRILSSTICGWSRRWPASSCSARSSKATSSGRFSSAAPSASGLADAGRDGRRRAVRLRRRADRRPGRGRDRCPAPLRARAYHKARCIRRHAARSEPGATLDAASARARPPRGPRRDDFLSAQATARPSAGSTCGRAGRRPAWSCSGRRPAARRIWPNVGTRSAARARGRPVARRDRANGSACRGRRGCRPGGRRDGAVSHLQSLAERHGSLLLTARRRRRWPLRLADLARAWRRTCGRNRAARRRADAGGAGQAVRRPPAGGRPIPCRLPRRAPRPLVRRRPAAVETLDPRRSPQRTAADHPVRARYARGERPINVIDLAGGARHGNGHCRKKSARLCSQQGVGQGLCGCTGAGGRGADDSCARQGGARSEAAAEIRAATGARSRRSRWTSRPPKAGRRRCGMSGTGHPRQQRRRAATGRFSRLGREGVAERRSTQT